MIKSRKAYMLELNKGKRIAVIAESLPHAKMLMLKLINQSDCISLAEKNYARVHMANVAYEWTTLDVIVED